MSSVSACKIVRFACKMIVCLAGAMSTAEIGISLAPLIHAGKVHAITCTGANIEEDLFNLVGNSRYKLQPNWRYLTMEDDLKTREERFNRVTDTCTPEAPSTLPVA